MFEEVFVTAMAVLFIGGHLFQIAFSRDDWPFSSYMMYAFRVDDWENNPFVPLRRETHSEFLFAFLALRLVLKDGTVVPLTDQILHPLLMPFDRLRIGRQLTRAFRKNEDLKKIAEPLAAWVARRNRQSKNQLPIFALEVHHLLWKAGCNNFRRNGPPDKCIVLVRVEKDEWC